MPSENCLKKKFSEPEVFIQRWLLCTRRYKKRQFKQDVVQCQDPNTQKVKKNDVY